MRVCAEPGCPALVDKGRCATHEAPIRQQERRHYTGIPGVNYGRRWQREAKAFLVERIWCVVCPDLPKHPATEVDHIKPHEGDPTLFWDRANWQPACKFGHSRKTSREMAARRG